MVVGVLHVELHLPMALSLKDKRSVLKSLTDQLHNRFNIAVAQVDPNEKWQRASLGIVTLSHARGEVEGLLQRVVEWMRGNRSIALIRVERELF